MSPDNDHTHTHDHVCFPRLVQSAFYVTIFYHLCVFDPNVRPVAVSVLGVLGASEGDGSFEQLVHVLCVVFMVGMAELQFFLGDPTLNPFTSVHELAYKALGAHRGDPKKAPTPKKKRN